MLSLRALTLLVPCSLVLDPASATAGVPSTAADVTHPRGAASSAPTHVRELPVTLHRRAVELLEERREAFDSPWADGRLSPDVTPLYRPGQAEPAYVEVAVVGPQGQPRGFMILATGRHDHPTVEVVMDGLAPSASLLQRAPDRAVGRMFRLGYGAYVLEDDRGRWLAQQGELPGKVIGYDRSWLEQPAAERAGHYEWDHEAGVTRHEPSAGQGVDFEPWPSWPALKREYPENYAVFHEMDRVAAADEWLAEDSLSANGGTLQNREFREFPLLSGRGGVGVRLSGNGVAAVHHALAERGLEGDMALRVFVDDAPDDSVAPVDIHLTYADGTVETLRLNVTARIPDVPPVGALGSLPKQVLGVAPRGRRVRAIDAPRINCSKAVVTTRDGWAMRQSGESLDITTSWRDAGTIVGIEHAPTGNVAFRSSDGLYWTATGGGGSSLLVNGTRRSTNQLFALYANPLHPQWYGLQTSDWRHYVRFTTPADATATAAAASAFSIGYCQPRRVSTRWAGKDRADVKAKAPRYDQIPARLAPNTSQCASGCAATAWAMLFGFHDYEASLGVPKWKPHAGLYRKDGKATGPDAVAPRWFWRASTTRDHGSALNKGAAAMVWEISQVMNDWVLAGCGPDGGKWTAPVLMGRAHTYLDRRGVKARLVSDYDGAAIMTAAGKKNAYAVIRKGQPVVIGIGHLEHYPLAVGRSRAEYRVWDRGAKRWSAHVDRRTFIVSMGWGRHTLEEVPYDTWMAGSLSVASTPATGVVVAAPRAKPAAPPASKPLPKTKPGVPLNPKKKSKLPGPKPGPLF